MRSAIVNHRFLPIVVLAMAALFVGCEGDDPTGPSNDTAVPVHNPQPSSAWNITVTASPSEFDLNEGNGTSTINVTATRAGTNQRVAEGTTAVLDTSAGTLVASDGTTGTSVPIVFDRDGEAIATLNTGTFAEEATIVVQAQIESSFRSANIQMQDLGAGAFQVASVSPDFGPPSGGTRLTITGSGFVEPIRVTIAAAGQTQVIEDARLVSSSQIVGTAPAIDLASGTNANATITVENAFNEQGNPTGTDSIGGFTYTRSGGITTLKLISITPTFGPNEGGTQVTINGEGFGSRAQVFFSNGPLIEATILEISPNQIEVMTPSATGPNDANSDSVVDVIVRDPDTGFQATLTGAFQYGNGAGGALFISSVSPDEDEYLGGTLVTIFGQGFEEPVEVNAGGREQQVISVTGTEVVFRTVEANIGCATSGGTVSVTNIDNNSVATGPNFVYVPIQPSGFQYGPSAGPASGGTLISVEGIRDFGQGFGPLVQVVVDGVVASGTTIINADGFGVGSDLSFVTPPFTGEFATTTDGCPDGQERLLPADVVIEIRNVETGCSQTLGFEYQPPSLACAGTITPPTADYTFDSTSMGSLTVAFTDTSAAGSSAITTYLWDFGTGDTSSLRNPSLTFPAPGNYDVSLTVTDGNGLTDTETKTITVPTF